MATSAQDFGGYNCYFVSEPPGVYTCLICTFVAKDCQQMDCCGRVYCRQCLVENKKHSNLCPNCRQFGNSFNDKKSDREIKALKVRCGNLDNGCQWVSDLCYLEEHFHTCDYVLTACINNCIVRVLKNDLENHLTNECPRRPYQCPHCQEIGEYEEMTTLHMDSCPKVRVQCPNTWCLDSMPRCDVSIHRSLCDYEKVTCKFSDIGCQERPFRKSLKDHEEDHTSHLPSIIANSLVLKKVIQEMEARNNEQDKHIQTLENRLQMASLNFPFTFRMEGYTRLKDEWNCFTSPSFYSAGYKFCVRVYPGGHGVGTGTHISVVICLTKGENDDFLTWPFTGSVTVELLNQLEDKNHHQVMTKLTSDNKCSQRVAKGEVGQGWGLPRFISSDRLRVEFDQSFPQMNNSITTNPITTNPITTNHRYLQQDSLVFRVSVQIQKPWLQCSLKH